MPNHIRPEDIPQEAVDDFIIFRRQPRTAIAALLNSPAIQHLIVARCVERVTTTDRGGTPFAHIPLNAHGQAIEVNVAALLTALLPPEPTK